MVYKINGCRKITDIKVTMGVRTPRATATAQPQQETEFSKALLLCPALVELGEALKGSCPPDDCVIYRNVYEMYCEKLADYRRIVAACPNLSDSTTRALEQAIRKDELQLYDMWKENIAVNRKREAIRSEKERMARITAETI